jgi:hypothetical protein
MSRLRVVFRLTVLSPQLIAASLLLATPAQPDPFTIAETLSLVDGDAEVFATIHPAYPGPDPGPVNCILFTCNLAGTDVVYFSVVVDTALFSASLSDVSVWLEGTTFSDIRGIGSIADPVNTAPAGATVDAGGSVLLSFDHLGADWADEEPESEVLFISYAPGVITAGGGAMFAIRRTDSSPFGDSGSVGVVPEPSTGLLVGFGLVAIAVRRRQ